MKYCEHCGAQIEDDAVYCLNCGCKVGDGAAAAEMSDRDKRLTLAAKIFMILACATCIIFGIVFIALAVAGGARGYYAFDVDESGGDAIAMGAYIAACITLAAAALLPLAYAIPMTAYVFKTERTGKPLGVAFKICTLIFINVISGILLFARKEPAVPVASSPETGKAPKSDAAKK